jgi:hypothetical protein
MQTSGTLSDVLEWHDWNIIQNDWIIRGHDRITAHGGVAAPSYVIRCTRPLVHMCVRYSYSIDKTKLTIIFSLSLMTYSRHLFIVGPCLGHYQISLFPFISSSVCSSSGILMTRSILAFFSNARILYPLLMFGCHSSFIQLYFLLSLFILWYTHDSFNYGLLFSLNSSLPIIPLCLTFLNVFT